MRKFSILSFVAMAALVAALSASGASAQQQAAKTSGRDDAPASFQKKNPSRCEGRRRCDHVAPRFPKPCPPGRFCILPVR